MIHLVFSESLTPLRHWVGKLENEALPPLAKSTPLSEM